MDGSQGAEGYQWGALRYGSQGAEGYPSRRLPLGSPSAPIGLGLRQPFARPDGERLGGLGMPPCGMLARARGGLLVEAWEGALHRAAGREASREGLYP